MMVIDYQKELDETLSSLGVDPQSLPKHHTQTRTPTHTNQVTKALKQVYSDLGIEQPEEDTR